MLEKRSLLIETLYLETATFTNGKFKAVFQKGDTPNANKRIYPMEYLVREMGRLNPIVEKRGLVGELDHPYFRDDDAESSVIHSQKVSHVITKLWQDGNFIWGELEPLNTPSGVILQEFLKAKVMIGVSSRSLGAAQQGANGFWFVDDSLKIVTWDSVVGPSVAESDLRGQEVQKEWANLLKETKNVANMVQKKQIDKGKEYDPDEVRYFVKSVMNEFGY